jgi:hypothetical protein
MGNRRGSNVGRIPQKIAKKRNKIYKGVKPVKSGERKPNSSTIGRSIRSTMKDFREAVESYNK